MNILSINLSANRRLDRGLQRRQSLIVFQVRVCTVIQQAADDRKVSRPDSGQKWRKVSSASQVWVCALVKQRLDFEDIATLQSPHQSLAQAKPLIMLVNAPDEKAKQESHNTDH